MYVDQRDFERLFKEAGSYNSETELARDLCVIRLIDKLPSLDPFLLREQLRINDISANASYFEISFADQERMRDCASRELSRLTELVGHVPGGSESTSTAKMVTALLCSEVSEKLEPMRAALGMDREEFREGVFSWRGFIYYKWTMSDFSPGLIKSLREIGTLAPVGRVNSEQRKYFAQSKAQILRGAKSNIDKIGSIIGIYDDAYGSLIERQNPKLFRDFLVAAPSLFLEIGEKMGALYHMSSFWKYRFPAGSSKRAEADELMTIFEDFIRCLNEDDIRRILAA